VILPRDAAVFFRCRFCLGALTFCLLVALRCLVAHCPLNRCSNSFGCSGNCTRAPSAAGTSGWRGALIGAPLSHFLLRHCSFVLLARSLACLLTCLLACLLARLLACSLACLLARSLTSRHGVSLTDTSRGMLSRTPPIVDSNLSLTMWLCERHNEVNRRLNKPEFPCGKENLEKAWGGCGCAEGAATDDVTGNATSVVPPAVTKLLRGAD
jgi:hypothetical protein